MHSKSIYVGIDNFTYKKGRDYISVVVDQMTHTPALLEDRTGKALDNWLYQNPQLQYIMRELKTEVKYGEFHRIKYANTS